MKMTNIKQYFTTIEILERAKEELENYDRDEIVETTDLVEAIANHDYYIIYIHEAIEALEQHGTWEAIGEVQEYELEAYGKVYTDLGDPVGVANMFWYIKVETVLYDLNILAETAEDALEIINEELEHLAN